MNTKAFMLLGLVFVLAIVAGCAEASDDQGDYYQVPSAGQGCGFAENTNSNYMQSLTSESTQDEFSQLL